MRAIVLLADAAQVSEGKLNVLGAGWAVTGPLPSPAAVAVMITIPWSEANIPHQVELQLFDEDGHPVMIQQPDGTEGPVKVDTKVEVGRPPGLKPGTPFEVPLAVNLPPLPLQPGHRFTWRLTIDGENNENWEVSFATRPLPEGMQIEFG